MAGQVSRINTVIASPRRLEKSLPSSLCELRRYRSPRQVGEAEAVQRENVPDTFENVPDTFENVPDTFNLPDGKELHIQ